MRYLRAGSGPPLILLHGLFAYSFSWRYTMPALAPYATVYALDMLGAGFSDRPSGIDHSMRGTALRVLKFAETVGLSSFDLLGTSRGGPVAMCAASEALGRKRGPQVRRLILVCPVNPYSPHGKYLAPFFATSFGAAGFRWAAARAPFIFDYAHARLYADRSKIPADSLAGYRAPATSPDFYELGLSIVRSWTADLAELQSVLPKLREIPTLLVWGSKDPAVYVSSMESLAKHFANVQKVVFPGVGHLPYEECPNEFNRALITFLTQ
jgi:pimeloyl-ACP methyl ester carboxylesterase